MLRQITFFRVSLVPKQCTGIVKVSNAFQMHGRTCGTSLHFRYLASTAFQSRFIAVWQQALLLTLQKTEIDDGDEGVLLIWQQDVKKYSFAAEIQTKLLCIICQTQT